MIESLSLEEFLYFMSFNDTDAIIQKIDQFKCGGLKIENIDYYQLATVQE